MNVDETLKDRGNTYGDFTLNVHTRARIMELLGMIHVDKNNSQLSPVDYQAINDIVIKLVRIAATPNHTDSWLDLEGYSRLNKERLNDDKQ